LLCVFQEVSLDAATPFDSGFGRTNAQAGDI
jgi:hypothetical protein